MKKNLLTTIAAPSALILALSMATLVFADDTELYSATYQSGATGKPKVLVLFDDSGSMSEVVERLKPDYDPNATYLEHDDIKADRIYWSTSGTPPKVDQSSGRDNWFPASANSCADSWSALETVGRYSGTPLYWQEADGEMERVCTRRDRQNRCTRYEDRWEGDAAGWLELDNDVNDPYTVDCRQDVLAKNNKNASGIGDGYPRAPNDPNTPNSNAYTAQSNSSNVDWEGGRVFYTSHYMQWVYDESIDPEDKDYLQIAQSHR
jgi:type IV pilus assembly protein PilY1